MTTDANAVAAINAVVSLLGPGLGGVVLTAGGAAIWSRFTNRHKIARERLDAEEAAQDRAVKRERDRATRAEEQVTGLERALTKERARADRWHGNWRDLIDAFAVNRQVAIGEEVPEEMLLDAPVLREMTAEETGASA